MAALLFSTAGAAQQQCTQTAYGQSCGPTLTVSFPTVGNHHMLSVVMQSGFPRSTGLWIWGSADLVFPIPGTQCNLYTNFVYGHPFMTGPDGSATMQRAWPAWVNGFVRLQAGSMMVENNQLVIRTTNAVLAECTTS